MNMHGCIASNVELTLTSKSNEPTWSFVLIGYTQLSTSRWDKIHIKHRVSYQYTIAHSIRTNNRDCLPLLSIFKLGTSQNTSTGSQTHTLLSIRQTEPQNVRSAAFSSWNPLKKRYRCKCGRELTHSGRYQIALGRTGGELHGIWCRELGFLISMSCVRHVAWVDEGDGLTEGVQWASCADTAEHYEEDE